MRDAPAPFQTRLAGNADKGGTETSAVKGLGCSQGYHALRGILRVLLRCLLSEHIPEDVTVIAHGVFEDILIGFQDAVSHQKGSSSPMTPVGCMGGTGAS